MVEHLPTMREALNSIPCHEIKKHSRFHPESCGNQMCLEASSNGDPTLRRVALLVLCNAHQESSRVEASAGSQR